ncbi:MAG: ATP-binding protein [Lachnospiraceae bacterium]|nr:ATP-binding protein [Lachnospiraceae bacterium]
MGLTNTQYNEIMRGYQRLQNQNRQEQTAREEEAYCRIPELSGLDAQISAASTACARALLGDAPDAKEAQIANLRLKISHISRQKTQLLQDAGFPADYLEPRYHCPDCRDTGYVGQEKCHCFKQAVIDLFYTQSNLRDSLRNTDFSAFSLEYYPETMIDPVTELTAAQMAARALQECRKFVSEFDRENENIFLSGDTGLGKTLLSYCIAKELLESTHSVIYFSAFRLFELLADSSFGRSENSESGEPERYIFECDLLIIDDLGTELVNSFVASQLFLVLNERILRHKSTLISTNLSLAAIAERYSERVLSRITSNYRMLRLIGDDIRLQKRFPTKIC